MSSNDLLILKSGEVAQLLSGREDEILQAIRGAYETHARGATSLPFSSFLRFPDSAEDRIISLPAYLGEDFGVAGIKWIASVPANVGRGMERASAVVVLNRRSTGRPEAILEGSIISKQRTAASAALASRVLRRGRSPQTIGFIGCGPINFEVSHFLTHVWQNVDRFLVYDLNADRAREFSDKFLADHEGTDIRLASSLPDLLAECSLTSFATTAIEPHVDDISMCPEDAVLLHVSLRDLTPAVILGHHNVIDDLDHVCRAKTSIHLASEVCGHRDFVHATLGELLLERLPLPPQDERRIIFSPFGMGILDLALAQLVYEQGSKEGQGTVIQGFLP